MGVLLLGTITIVEVGKEDHQHFAKVCLATVNRNVRRRNWSLVQLGGFKFSNAAFGFFGNLIHNNVCIIR